MSQTDFEFSINISKTLEKAKCQVNRFLHFREKKVLLLPLSHQNTISKGLSFQTQWYYIKAESWKFDRGKKELLFK